MPARKPSDAPPKEERLSPLGLLFSERLKALRVESDLSQAELAEAAGVNVTYVSALERGRREPGLAIVERLAKALNVTPAEMLTAPKGKK